MISRRQTLTGLTAAGLMVALTSARAQSFSDRLTGDLSPVHDPCIIRDEAGCYHVFSTSQMGEGRGLIHWRTSPDLVTWTFRGAVMQMLPDWVTQAVPGTRGAWAPDIAFFNRRYHLYYSASTFGSNRSIIGLVTTATLDTADPAFGWRDEGLVVESDRFNRYNAIDPNHVIDADGRHWLAFGSFWSGIQLCEADPATGKPKNRAKKPKTIATRPKPGAVEAPFIVGRGDWYYLFASYDFCCRGVDSSYYTVVGRSAAIDGPYVDAEGRKLLDGGGTTVLIADERWKGPGHCAVLNEGYDWHVVYHAYDAENGGRPTLRVRELNWTADGWPVAM